MKVIVAPLNWGLGHASRCIPIIQKLIQEKFIPVLASDGYALNFLKKEFPNLTYIELPTYQIYYGRFLKLSLLENTFTFLKAKRLEYQMISKFISQNNDVVGIISDNRFGVHSTKVPSVYLTHQTTVLSGFFSFLTTYFHQKVIQKFDECWIPDNKELNLSGKLSDYKKDSQLTKYIGCISRLSSKEIQKTWEILILLSGPEPRRTLLEKKLIKKFLNSEEKVLLVQGKIDQEQKWTKEGNIKLVNYLLSNELEDALNQSDKVIARSGYSSIIDLCSLEKKAVFIPTKGQNEQEYLANYLKEILDINFIPEDKILNTDINKMYFRTLPKIKTNLPENLFDLFKGK